MSKHIVLVIFGVVILLIILINEIILEEGSFQVS